MRAILRFLREGICWNQGEIIQYSYLASILHKYLKELNTREPDNIRELRKAAEALLNFLNRNLQRICKENFKFMHQYYDNRSNIKPRICVKGTFNQNIVELFRDKDVNYMTNYPIDSNTGFKYVYDNGKYYLCNNIPQAVIKGEYKNPRLNIKKIKQNHKKILNRIKKDIEENEWIEYWHTEDENNISKLSCYKSTLIVPMTLWNNSLSKMYKELTNIENVDRTIFGFLCFDHVTTGYFDEANDVDLGYIFADILSIYLINRLNYTMSSETFKSVMQKIFEDTELTRGCS